MKYTVRLSNVFAAGDLSPFFYGFFFAFSVLTPVVPVTRPYPRPIKLIARIAGPIIRINPNELHIKDSDFYDELYAPAAKKRDKFKDFVILSGTPNASFATVAHNHHRLRRSALNPFFSKMVVGRMEPLILEKVERLATRFTEAAQSKDKPVLRLDAAFMALTMDIICHYAYGESYNYLDDDDFRARWREAMISALENGILLRNFPWILPIMQSIPYSVLQRINPNGAALMEWAELVKRKIAIMMKEHAQGNKASGTIFHTVLDSDLPPEEKSFARLLDEGQSVVGAGSETTANTLTIIMFYLLRDKSLLQKLRAELASAPTQTPMLPSLEKLPYLVKNPQSYDNNLLDLTFLSDRCYQRSPALECWRNESITSYRP